MGKLGSGGDNRDEVTMDEYLAAKTELDDLRREHGLAPREGRVSRAISRFFERRESREPQKVNRKKYLLLALFTGWMGGHRFYARRWLLASLYLAFFWTGLPFAMTIIDIMAAVPREVDGDGNIYL